MKTQSPYEDPVRLIPASERPLRVCDYRKDMAEFLSDFDAGEVSMLRYLRIDDPAINDCLFFEMYCLSLPEIERFAAGMEVRTPYGETGVEAPGTLRMAWLHEGGKFADASLEFLPDNEVRQGITFDDWLALRFPHSCYGLGGVDQEDRMVFFHQLWAQETNPEPSLAPDDGLLWKAAINNHERLLEAILERQPKIEVRLGTEKTITQTALGIAMENTGMFGTGPGFACGCHRRFRDDDFCQAETWETWVPRAERIAERLGAAGAIDYSPMLKACREGRTEDVEAMLKQGFPANFSIYGHTTAMCEAVQPGHEDLCDLLLCHGADPNLPRPFSTSMMFGGEIYPLTLATEHPAILKRLLEAGADPSIRRDDSEDTPVVIVADFQTRENAEEVFSLVDFASIRGKYGRSCVFYLHSGNLELCRNIIPAGLLDARDELGMTPLLHAIVSENPEKALLLLEMGADPSLPGMAWDELVNAYLRSLDTGRIPSQRLTPIQAALVYGQLDLVEHLLDRGMTPSRHSQVIRVPKKMEEQAFETLRIKLNAELEALRPEFIVKRNGMDSYFDPIPSALEPLLATLLMNDPDAAARYPEWIETLDLVAWAKGHGLHPALIEPFRNGRKLGKADWMLLLDNAVHELRDATEAFAKTLKPQPPDGTECADTRDLLAPLRHAEQALLAATARITGKTRKPLNLAAQACERASGDFMGGTARAYRDAETTGNVGFDDFVEALAEHASAGSTMDHGKLLHAVRLITARLEKRCAALRRKT